MATLSWGYDIVPGGSIAPQPTVTARRRGRPHARDVRATLHTHARAPGRSRASGAAGGHEPPAVNLPAGQRSRRARPGRACRSSPRGCACSGFCRATRLSATRTTDRSSSAQGFRAARPRSRQIDRAIDHRRARRVSLIACARSAGHGAHALAAGGVSRPTVFVNVALYRLWATDPKTGRALRMNVRWKVPRPQTRSSSTGWSTSSSARTGTRPTGCGQGDKSRAPGSFLFRARTSRSWPAATRTRRRCPHAGEPLHVLAGRLHVAKRAEELARPAKFIFPNAEDVCAGTPAQRCSRGHGATSATAASVSRIRPVSPNGCCATSRNGAARGSPPRCRRAVPRASTSRSRSR